MHDHFVRHAPARIGGPWSGPHSTSDGGTQPNAEIDAIGDPRGAAGVVYGNGSKGVGAARGFRERGASGKGREEGGDEAIARPGGIFGRHVEAGREDLL